MGPLGVLYLQAGPFSLLRRVGFEIGYSFELLYHRATITVYCTTGLSNRFRFVSLRFMAHAQRIIKQFQFILQLLNFFLLYITNIIAGEKFRAGWRKCTQ
jgi:hypothetical protein